MAMSSFVFNNKMEELRADSALFFVQKRTCERIRPLVLHLTRLRRVIGAKEIGEGEVTLTTALDQWARKKFDSYCKMPIIGLLQTCL